MKLLLKSLDPLPRGIYGPHKDRFPPRAAFLHPLAAESFAAWQNTTGWVVAYSDIWRSAESSLQAIETKAGVKAPGYSAHGYGLAFDLDVNQALRVLECEYQDLLSELAVFGFHCHRRDGERGNEDWHFNFLGNADQASVMLGHTSPDDHDTWGRAAELAIQFAYPEVTARMEPHEIQMALAMLGLYHGTIDGELGRQSRAAAQAFSRAWRCHEHGPEFERTLRFVAAEIVHVDATT